MRAMYETVRSCLPVTFISFAIFVRSDMVGAGWASIFKTPLASAAPQAAQ